MYLQTLYYICSEMKTISENKETKVFLKNESLKVNVNKKHVSGRLNSLKFIDKDTKQHVIYIPSLEISGYGETEAKAKEMLYYGIKDMFNILLNMSLKFAQIELYKLGWKRTIFKKEFSHTCVDSNGVLSGFEAEGEIEKNVLSVALYPVF